MGAGERLQTLAAERAALLAEAAGLQQRLTAVQGRITQLTKSAEPKPTKAAQNAVAANLVADPFQNQHPVLIIGQRLHDRFELKISPFLVRPEVLLNDTIGAEHDDQTLLASQACTHSLRVHQASY